jgi:hypothetical protein
MSITVKNNSFIFDADSELNEAITVAQELFGNRFSLIGFGDNIFKCVQDGDGVNCSISLLPDLLEWWDNDWNINHFK